MTETTTRQAEIAHVMELAQQHGLTVDPEDVEFEGDGHYPYIEGHDAEDWIQEVCGCGGECLTD